MDKTTIDTSSIIIVPPIAPNIIIEFGDIMMIGLGIIVCNEVAITVCREKWNHSEQSIKNLMMIP